MGRRRTINHHLPPRMQVSRGCYFRVVRQKWTHLGNRLDAALQEYARLEQLDNGGELVRYRGINDVPLYVYRKARNSARTRGIDFYLLPHHVSDLYEQSGGKCSLTGIPFEYYYKTGDRTPPWAPSLDRIESSKGYTPENVRLVCVAVNMALNTWGEDVLHRIADHLKRKSRKNSRQSKLSRQGKCEQAS